MADKKVRRHKRTKGVVLFTVVAIMFMLLIMIMATLAVVSSANRRTYTKFKENQAYFTARSAVDGFVIAASNKTDGGSNNQLYKDFYKLCKNGTVVKESDVPTFDDLDSNSNVMKAELTFPQPSESGGDLKYLFGTCKLYAHKTSDYTGRIIAHVTLDDCESSVFLYIEWDPPKPDLFKNAMTSFDKTTSAIGMSIMGGASVDIAGSAVNPAATTLNYMNSGKVVRSASYGSGVTFHSTPQFIFQDVVPKLEQQPDGSFAYVAGTPQYAGLTVMGDCNVANNIKVSGNATAGYTPYVYVDGYLTNNSSGSIFGADVSGNYSTDPKNSVNVYCNRLSITNGGNKFNGDITIYNATSDSNETSVFAEQTSDATGDSYFNGEIKGDIYCDGNLKLGQNAKVNGNIYCSGTLTFENIDTTCVSGTFVGGLVLDKTGADITADHTYTNMPATYKEKNTVRGKATGSGKYTSGIITIPSSNMNNYGGVNEKNEPLNDGSIYPAFGYYKDGNTWTPRTTPDPSWTRLSNLFPMNSNGATYEIDATTNDQKFVVDGVLFGDNVNNNYIVIKGDKKVEFYFTNTARLYSGGSSGNMIVTEKFYDNMVNHNNQYMTSVGEDNLILNTFCYFEDGSNFEIKNSMIMGYMYGPNATVTLENGKSVDNTYYDGVSVGTNPTNFIGSCVFGAINGTNNNGGFFLPPSNKADDGENPDKFWRDVYYSNH